MENIWSAKLCLLVDGDNATPSDVGKVLQIAKGLGNVLTKRIYGGGPILEAWKDAALEHGLDVVHQYAYTKGKNATDMAMTIDAMDLLHSGAYDGFCLMTSDFDFTPLVKRIGKSGKKAYGFGNSSTPQAFRNACGNDCFHVVREIKTKPPIYRKPFSFSSYVPPQLRPQSSSGRWQPAQPPQKSQQLPPRADARPVPPVRKICAPPGFEILDDALAQQIARATLSVSDDQGFAPLSAIGNRLIGVVLPGGLKHCLETIGFTLVRRNGGDYVQRHPSA